MICDCRIGMMLPQKDDGESICRCSKCGKIWVIDMIPDDRHRVPSWIIRRSGKYLGLAEQKDG